MHPRDPTMGNAYSTLLREQGSSLYSKLHPLRRRKKRKENQARRDFQNKPKSRSNEITKRRKKSLKSIQGLDLK
jgi:hypothetical protein